LRYVSGQIRGRQYRLKFTRLPPNTRTFTALNFVFELAKSKDTSKFSGQRAKFGLLPFDFGYIKTVLRADNL